VPFALLALFGTAYALTDIPPANKVSQAQTTVLRYAGGEEMARLGTNRELVALSEMSEPAQKAVLAAEDRGFYTEPGISPKGIARALFTNLRGGGGVQQGGSTITQQYAKNVYLSSERTYTRKLKEALIAIKINRERSKEQILEDYLNTIYFGRGAYGIQAASKAYFGAGASARTLTAEQGAVLASSIRSPAGYEPAKHPDRARQRWDYVLDGMVQEGWLGAPERAAAAYPAVIAPGSGATGADLSGPIGHVVDAVQEELLKKGFAEDQVNADGLTVTTTLDKRAQDAAVKAVETVNKGDKGDTALQGALVAVVPGDGAVRAYYGGANGSGLDYAGGVVPGGQVVRQPGSSMKPYVLATALEQGISLTTRYDGSSPQRIAGQRVQNAGNEQAGTPDLVTATAESVNTVYFRLAVDVGPGKVAELAHRAGIPEDVALAPASGRTEAGIALGQYEVHVTDQAAGFATFAAGGTHATPYLVAKVERDGATDYQAQAQTRQAFSKQVAADAAYAMQQVIRSGTGTRARLAGGRPAAGKTGTTDDSTNVWFCGFTPQLSTAVWFGFGDAKTPVTRPGGGESTGGVTSAAVWKSFMDAALAGQPEKPLPPRAGVGRNRSKVAASPAPRSPGPTSTTLRPAPAPTVSPSPTPSPATSPAPSPSASPSASPQPTATKLPTRTPRPTSSTPNPARTGPSPTGPPAGRGG